MQCKAVHDILRNVTVLTCYSDDGRFYASRTCLGQVNGIFADEIYSGLIIQIADLIGAHVSKENPTIHTNGTLEHIRSANYKD
jgi:hypothetical protein